MLEGGYDVQADRTRSRSVSLGTSRHEPAPAAEAAAAAAAQANQPPRGFHNLTHPHHLQSTSPSRVERLDWDSASAFAEAMMKNKILTNRKRTDLERFVGRIGVTFGISTTRNGANRRKKSGANESEAACIV